MSDQDLRVSGALVVSGFENGTEKPMQCGGGPKDRAITFLQKNMESALTCH